MRVTLLLLLLMGVTACSGTDPACENLDPAALARRDFSQDKPEPTALFQQCGTEEADIARYRETRTQLQAAACSPARAFELARKGEPRPADCPQGLALDEAYQLGALLRGHELGVESARAQIAALPDTEEGKAERGRLQRMSRAREVEVESLRGVAAVKGWL